MQSTQPKHHQLLFSIKKLFFFSLPIISNSLLSVLPILASTWILSRLGKDQFAAAAIATPTFFTIATTFVTVFYAVGIKIGHCFGENKQHPEIAEWLRTGIVLAFILSCPAVIILLNADHILLWLGQKPHLVSIAKPFFTFGAPALVMMIFNFVINQYFCGIGHSKIALILSIITLPFIIGLSYLFVLGKLGLPQLGLAGINCASFIVDFIVLVLSIIIAITAKWSKLHRPFATLSGISKAKCLQLFKIGWPISIQLGGELSALTAAAYLLGLFGTSALAAAQVTGQYVTLFIMISVGLASGTSILISQAYGANNKQEIKHIAHAGMILIAIISGCFVVAFISIPQTLIDWYLDIHNPSHSQLVSYAIKFMSVAAIYVSFDGIRNILTSALRGLQDTKKPMQITMCCLWLIGIPCAYIAGFTLHGGPVMLRLAYQLGIISATLFILYRYRAIVSKRLKI